MVRQQQVTDTSIDAYYSLTQKEKQERRIAEFILSRSLDGKPSWIRQIARDLQMESSTVSARLNALKKCSTFVSEAGTYILIWNSKQKDPVTGVTADAWMFNPVSANNGNA